MLHYFNQGDVFKSKRHAKRSVFKKACELLYEAGELTELLLPKRLDDNDVVENDFLQGLAHDNLRRAGMSKLGTKKSIRIYNKTVCLLENIFHIKRYWQLLSVCSRLAMFFNVFG